MASDFFSDKKYEDLDWISQAVEPWEWDLLDKIRQLPESIEVTPQDIIDHHDSYYGFSWTNMIKVRLLGAGASDDDGLISYDDLVRGVYKLQLAPDTRVDFRDNSLSAAITLIKQKPTIADTDCQKIAASRIYQAAGAHRYDLRDSDQYRRAGEILDLIGADMTLCRGHRNRRSVISSELQNIFSQDKWRIRSMPLVDKIGLWIADYIRSGNVSAMANFAKLKVMTHAGKPIYSIVEVE